MASEPERSVASFIDDLRQRGVISWSTFFFGLLGIQKEATQKNVDGLRDAAGEIASRLPVLEQDLGTKRIRLADQVIAASSDEETLRAKATYGPEITELATTIQKGRDLIASVEDQNKQVGKLEKLRSILEEAFGPGGLDLPVASYIINALTRQPEPESTLPPAQTDPIAAARKAVVQSPSRLNPDPNSGSIRVVQQTRRVEAPAHTEHFAIRDYLIELQVDASMLDPKKVTSLERTIGHNIRAYFNKDDITLEDKKALVAMIVRNSDPKGIDRLFNLAKASGQATIFAYVGSSHAETPVNSPVAPTTSVLQTTEVQPTINTPQPPARQSVQRNSIMQETERREKNPFPALTVLLEMEAGRFVVDGGDKFRQRYMRALGHKPTEKVRGDQGTKRAGISDEENKTFKAMQYEINTLEALGNKYQTIDELLRKESLKIPLNLQRLIRQAGLADQPVKALRMISSIASDNPGARSIDPTRLRELIKKRLANKT